MCFHTKKSKFLCKKNKQEKLHFFYQNFLRLLINRFFLLLFQTYFETWKRIYLIFRENFEGSKAKTIKEIFPFLDW